MCIVALLCGSVKVSASKLTTVADTTKTSKKHELVINANIYDHLTHDHVDSVRAELLNASDSSFIDSAKIDIWDYWDHGSYKKNTALTATIDKPGNYLLRVAAYNYTTQYIPVEIKKIYKNELSRRLKPIYLRHVKKRNEEELDEVIVEATKLKFYMDGDTLVYDADAFPMAEGSMLSDLIKKLPGVEIEKGGVIKVNGKKVDAMLLNGKDFFNEDRELLLDNMPSYMVKSINSYERVPEQVKNTAIEKSVEKEMVLDVKLKKDYNEGWIVTAEGGEGSTFSKNNEGKYDNKYLGRLFAMRFTNKSRLVVCATTNNVNDTREPGNDGNWAELRQTTGLTTNAMANINYNMQFAEEKKYEGSLKSTYYDITDKNNSSTTTFLQSGDIFGRSAYAKRSYDWDITFNNRFTLYDDYPESNVLKQMYFRVNPYFYYRKWNNHSESASAQFNQDVASNLGKDWLDSIKAPLAGDLLKKYAINRSITNNKGIGHWYDSHNFLTFGFTPAHNDKLAITLDINHRITENKDETFEHYSLEHPYSNEKGTFQNRYRPSLDWNHEIGTNFSIDYAGNENNYFRVGVYHYYSHVNSDRPLYMLNMLNGWDKADTEHSLGELPSMEEWLQTMDMQNSSHTITNDNTFTPSISYTYNHKNDSTKISHYFNIRVNAAIKHENMDYERGAVLDTTVYRNAMTWFSSISYSRRKHGTPNYTGVSLQFSESVPNLNTLLNIRDNSNPLLITLGNPNLKRTRSYYASIRNHMKIGKVLIYKNANINIRPNAVSQGFVMDSLGVKTTKPENINGNWNARANVSIDFPFDKNERLRMHNSLSYDFTNNVDLVGSVGDTVPRRSTVKNHFITEDIRLTWQPTKKMEYGLFGSLSMQRSTSHRQNFNNIEAYTFNYGCRMQVELPWNINVSSDLTMYSRRGYDDDAMNDNELVWNARISKRMCKGKLTVMFDGFDILGNLSNMYRNVNGQGRTETFYNVIPSYGLVRLVYRFNKQPKKS